jgi:Predicted Zn-dependent protease (DUF2268)
MKSGGIALLLALVAQNVAAVELEFAESARSSISDAERRTIQEMAASIDDDVRAVLAGLPVSVVLEVRAEQQPYSRTGASGAALGSERIEWVVDTSRAEGVVAIAERTLRAIMFHELHHLARGCTQSGPPFRSFIDGAICEGMATAFARDFASAEQPWQIYPSEVESWFEQVKDLSASATTGEWMFFHSDGRAWVGYKVGTFLVDRAMQASGRSAADLVGVASEDIVKMAGYE